MRAAIAAGAVLALAGCSGGSLSQAPATVGGIFSGTLTEGANSYGVSGIIDENGVSRFVEYSGSSGGNDLSYIAVIAPSSDIPDKGGSGLSIPFTEISINGEDLGSSSSTTESGTLAVNFTLRNSIAGTFTTINPSTSTTDQNGILNLSFLGGTYNSPPTTIAGTYSFTYSSGGNSYLADILIGDGTISGSDNNGCTYSGSYTIPDASYNAYDVSLTVGACANAPGALTGLAVWYPAGGSQPNTIDAILSNSTSAAYLVLQAAS